MNAPIYGFKKNLIAVAITSLLLVACSTPAVKPAGADAARSKLTQLQSDAQLSSLAPVAMKNAELAVQAAEKPQKDLAAGKHLVFMADRKVELASAQAQSRLLVEQRQSLSEQRGEARLDSRTREADMARNDAAYARTETDIARMETAAAVEQANMERMNTDSAVQQANDLQLQIAALNAKPTDRGLVMTLGDVLFANGKSELKPSATNNLDKLTVFLNKYQERSVTIEGHTDSVGSDAFNLDLSQRRADSVKSYLLNQGIEASRLVASGKGENQPVASNNSASDRQQNRRVEIIIETKVSAAN